MLPQLEPGRSGVFIQKYGCLRSDKIQKNVFNRAKAKGVQIVTKSDLFDREVFAV